MSLKIKLLGVLLVSLLCLISPIMAAACSPTYTNSTAGEVIVKFNVTGVCQWTAPANMSIDKSPWIFVLAGGGGGGGQGGGGGGAGGGFNGTLSTFFTSHLNSSQSYNVAVGAGGTGYDGVSVNAINGKNSSFANTTAGNGINMFGGGSGGESFGASGSDGADGGSGGGAAASGSSTYGGIALISAYGKNGGNNTNNTYGGAGGGGRNSAGLPVDIYGNGSNGGGGFSSTVSGASVAYAGGGGGGTQSGVTAGNGGAGGGGSGGLRDTSNGTNATPERGAGGGGSGYPGHAAGNGSSGLVYVRYFPVTEVPIVNFTQNKSVVALGGAVLFTSDSTNSTSWSWEFGDGNTSTSESVGFIYSSVGNYTVTLNVSNGIGSNITSKIQTITVTDPPYVPIGNPDFEYGSGSATVTGAWVGSEKYNVRYSKTSIADNTFDMFDANFSHHGSQSMKINITNQPTTNFTRAFLGGGTVVTYTDHHFMVEPLHDYNLTLWYKTNNIQSTSYFRTALVAGPNGSTITAANGSDFIYPVATTQDWTLSNNIFTVGSGSFEAAIYTELFGTGSAWVDDIKLMEMLTVNLTQNVSSGTVPFTVKFNSTITNGTPTYGNWSFGDGSYSSDYNTTHTYTVGGTYTVNFTAANGDNFENPTTVSTTIIAHEVPIPQFAQMVASGARPLTIQFYDNSTESPTSWDWDWGDGTAHGTIQNPSHTYTTNGIFNITLTVSNAYGSNDTTDNRAAVVGDIPNNNVLTKKLYLPFNGTDGDKINIFDWSGSNNTILNYGNAQIDTGNKKFGTGSILMDGISSSSGLYVPNNISLEFGSSNFYVGWWENVSTRPANSNILTGQKYSSGNRLDGYIAFTLGYSGGTNIRSYISSDNELNSSIGWDILNAALIGNVTTNQWVYYSVIRNGTSWQQWKNGVLTQEDIVSATVNNYNNTSLAIGGVFAQASAGINGNIDDFVLYKGSALNGSIVPDVELISNPTASFTKNASTGSAPRAIAFTNTSIGNQNVSTYKWNFTNVTGNNTRVTFSTSASPTYTFGVGNWSINLTVTNQFGNSTSASQFVNVSAPVNASFITNVTFGAIPFTVQFNDTSSGTPIIWNWTITSANGTTFNSNQNFSILFSTPDTFTVTLNATNSDGSSNKSVRIILAYSPINSSFTKNKSVCGMPCGLLVSNNSLGKPTGLTWFFGDEDYNEPWVIENASGIWEERIDLSGTTLFNGSIIFMAGQREFYGKSNDVWISTNNGTFWSLTNTSLQPWVNRSYTAVVTASDGSIILAGGDGSCAWGFGGVCDDVWRSNDGGNSWIEMNHTIGNTTGIGPGGYLVGHRMAAFKDGSLLIMGGFGGGYGIIRSTDSGRTWTLINNSPLLYKEFYSSVVMPNDDVIIIDSSSVWKSSDKGFTWTLMTNTGLSLVGLYPTAVSMPDSSIVLMSDNNVIRSTTNGSNWSVINSSSGLNRRSATSVLAFNGKIIVIGGENVLTSVKLNDTWSFNPASAFITSPSHLYNSSGKNYSINLVAYNRNTSNLSTQYLLVHNLTTNAFTQNVSSIHSIDGTAAVKFTATSTNATMWNWSWDDGTWTNLTNGTLVVDHIFSNYGNYTINLTTYEDGFGGFTHTDYVEVLTPIVSNFTSNVTKGNWSLPVLFNSASTNGTPTGWTWFFGDEDYSDPWNLINSSPAWISRFGHQMGVLHDGSIILTGGFNGGTGLVTSNETWRSNDGGNTWILVNSSSEWSARYRHTMEVLQDNSIIIMGGTDDSFNELNDVWRSVDEGNTWVQINASAGWAVRHAHETVLSSNGNIILFGGSDGGTWYNDVWVSSDKGYTWSQRNASAGWNPRAYFGSTLLVDNTIVIAAGQGTGGLILGDVWGSYDGGVTWRLLNGNPAAWTNRSGLNMVTMPDNTIVLFGGGNFPTLPRSVASSNSGISWGSINTTAGWTGRQESASVVTTNGTIVLTGGYDSTTLELNDTWSFSPAGSYVQNPVHVYNPSYGGCYSVSLLARNDTAFNNTFRQGYMTIYNQTTNDFTPNLSTIYTLGLAAFEFTETDQNATMWNWSWGDGNFTNITNGSSVVNHVYSSYGNKTVILRTYESGYGLFSRTHYVNIVYAMGTAFIANPMLGTVPLTVTFTDQTLGGPTTWNWSFGDGTYSSTQNPTHTFTSVGTYKVILNASNSYGWGNYSLNISVGPGYPVSQFTASPTYGAAPLTVQFTDTSITTDPTTYAWNFGDGFTSTDQNPSHEYMLTGDYHVTLTVTDAVGSDISNETIIHVSSSLLPFVDFIGTPTSSTSHPLTVQFTDLTTNIILAGSSWNWSFGDGNYSPLQNPSHTYVSSGIYTVRLTVANYSFTNYTTKTSYISVGDYSSNNVFANFVASPTYSASVPVNVQFTSTSVCTPACTQWSWDFNGDGAIDSVVENPSYTYTYPGNYSPKLIVSNGIGSDTKIRLHYITVGSIFVPTTIPQPTGTWIPTYQNGTYNIGNGYVDLANSTYLKYWLQNLTATGNFSIYGFSLGILSPIMHVFGFWIFLIIWALYLFAVWIRSQDVTLPLIIGILSMGTFGLLFPKEALPVIIIMFAICGAIIIYKIAKGD